MKVYYFRQQSLHKCAPEPLHDKGQYLYSSEKKATNAVKSFVYAWLNSQVFSQTKLSSKKSNKLQEALNGNVKDIVTTFNNIFSKARYSPQRARIEFLEMEVDFRFDFSTFHSFHY